MFLGKIYTSCNIRIQPDLEKPGDQWLPHPMIDNPKFCFFQARLRIYRRFVLLCDKPNTLVAVYRKNAKSRGATWPVKRGIESKLQMAAWKVLYPRETKIKGSLANITPYSIYFEAVMLLFEANATNIQVMGRLQYKSIAFQMYYRNTPVLAQIHTKAMESSDNYMSSQAVLSDFEEHKED